MKHKIGQNLLEWKNSETRKPFILQGARQVGKTYIVNFFARKEYSNYIYCNFGFENGIKSVPLYAIFCIGECIINKLFF